MRSSLPHYLLFTESQHDDFDEHQNSGFWRFIIQSVDNKKNRFEAVDREYLRSEQVLELWAVIRGLEHLEQPSQITLVTANRYICHGFRRGLAQWSANDWQWERFGEMIPIKNAELWQRIHRALEFHEIDCRFWRIDESESRESTAVRKPNFLNRRNVQFEFEPAEDEAPTVKPATEKSSRRSRLFNSSCAKK